MPRSLRLIEKENNKKRYADTHKEQVNKKRDSGIVAKYVGKLVEIPPLPPAVDIKPYDVVYATGSGIPYLVIITTRTLVLCSNGDTEYTIFRRCKLVVQPGFALYSMHKYDGLDQAGRLLHYIIAGGKVDGEPCTIDDLVSAVIVYSEMLRRRGEMAPNGFDIPVKVMDESLRTFEQTAQVYFTVDAAIKALYEKWWMAPIIEAYEGIDGPIADGGAEAV
jgi:hypothetical protein